MDYLVISIRTIISYAILIIALRIMGKREIGQLNLFDLIILLSIADVMVISIEEYELNYLYILLPVILLTMLQKLAALILLKSSKLRTMIDGKPSIIILNGVIQIEEMKKQSYNMDDLLLQLRSQNIFDVSLVHLAVLENNGMLSIVEKSEVEMEFSMPIIVSGVLEEELIQIYGIDKEKVIRAIGNNCLSIDKILCGYYDTTDMKLYLNDGKFIKIKLI